MKVKNFIANISAMTNNHPVIARYACLIGSGVQARYACSNGSGVQARYACSNGSGVQARYALPTIMTITSVITRFAGRQIRVIQNAEQWITRTSRVMTLAFCRVTTIAFLAFLTPNTAHAQCVNPAGSEGDVMLNSTFGVPAYCDGSDNWVAMSGGNPNDAVAPTTGLVGHWAMDAASGDIIDLSPSGYDCPAAGTGTITYQVPGPTGTAINFSGGGTETRFDCGDDSLTPALDITGAITVSAWVNVDAAGGYIVSKRGSSGNRGYRLEMDGASEAEFSISPNGIALEFSGSSTTALTPGEWYHVVGVFEPSTRISLYINGVKERENTTSISAQIYNSTRNFQIAADNGNGELDGSLDDVRVYNVALSDEEVATLYASTGGTYASNTTQIVPDGLVGHWRLDEESGTTAFDSSGNGNDGTMIGGLTGSNTVGGQVTKALNLDGSTHAIDILNSNGSGHALDFTNGPFTILAWIKPENHSGTIFTKRSGSNNQYQFIVSAASTLGFLAGSEFGFGATTLNIDGSTWYHAVVVVDSSNNPEFYLNGLPEAWVDQSGSRPYVFSYVDTNAAIGARWGSYPNTSFLFDGDIDDVRIYNRALTADEIAEIYEARDGIRYNAFNRAPEYFDGNAWNAMTVPPSEPYGGPSGTGYVPNAVEFDGGDNFVDSDGFTVPSSQQMTISFWFNRAAGYSGNDFIFDGWSGGDRRFTAYLTSAGEILVDVEDDTGATIVTQTSALTPDTDTWYHYIMSFDASTGDAHVYINDVDDGCCGGPVGIGLTPDITIDEGFGLGGNYQGNNEIGAAIADLWIDYGSYLDLSVEANRRKFIDASGNPVNLGADGSAPTGSQPDFFFSGAPSEFGVNKGTAALDFVQTGTLTASLGPNATSLGLVAHWTLDETEGTTAFDTSGNGNDGTMQGLMDAEDDTTSGAVGTSLAFDGVDDYVEVAHTPELDMGTSPFTVSFWARPDDVDQYSQMVVKQVASSPFTTLSIGTGGFTPSGASGYLTDTSKQFHFTIRDDGTNQWVYETTNDEIDGNWVHIALVRPSSGSAVAYLNGSTVPITAVRDNGLGAQSDVSNTEALEFGYDRDESAYFSGELDDVRIYDRALSDYEIQQLYQMGTPAGSSTALPQGCPNIGDVCDDGTIYAGLSPDGSVEMFTTPEDQGDYPWNNGNNADYNSAGTTSGVTGASNTNTIVTVDSDTGTAGFQQNQAAQICYDLVAHGADDWYLPAYSYDTAHELNILLDNLVPLYPSTFNGGGNSYWSSTETSANSANILYFDSSGVTGNGTNAKEQVRGVRCVRKGPAPRCLNPTAVEGSIVYNLDHDVMQFCDGARWRAIGKLQ